MTEAPFSELKRKDVINIEDGRRLGCIIDLVFESCSGRILGFVVPGERRLFNFKGKQDIFIPYLLILSFCCRSAYTPDRGGRVQI